MATRNRTIVVQERSFAAGDAAVEVNLPVNPLSFLDVTLRGLVAAGNTLPTFTNMLAVLSRVEVLFKGSSVVSVTPADLFFLQHAMGWLAGAPQPHFDSAGESWELNLRVALSRVPFWMKEGFPASRSGELTFRYTPAAAFTNVATLSVHVESEEILDGQFANYLKYTTITRTPTATGESDVDLPIGNDIAAVGLFGTTVPVGGSANASMREVRLLVDNQEALIPRTRWRTLHQQAMARMSGAVWMYEHSHRTGAAPPAANEVLENASWQGTHIFANYALLEFDPLRDDAYMFQTNGRSQIKLRINADVADVQRIIPVEMIKVGGAAA